MKNLVSKILICLLIIFNNAYSQDNANIIGNFSMFLQSYNKDTSINAKPVPEKVLINSFANLIYYNKNFSAGIRYEGYLNPLEGYNKKNDGFGISYRFFAYKNNFIDVTVGNFYDQFGNGLIFRSYEDKNIGIDNALDGIKLKINLIKGLTIKGFFGRQRFSFSKNNFGYSSTINKGLLKGIDFDINLNDMFVNKTNNNFQMQLGFSFVTKYQENQLISIVNNDTTYSLKLPLNVGAFSTRIFVAYKSISFNCEYAYKINDPNLINNFIYKDANAFFGNLNFFSTYLGINFMVKYVDNFSFKSDRNAIAQDLDINYIPDITKNHIYSFSAFYPYSSQFQNEIGASADISIKIPKSSFLGGKYGTLLKFYFSRMNDILKTIPDTSLNISQKGTIGYKTKFFGLGNSVLYQDICVNFEKKFTKNFQLSLIYQNIRYNYKVLRGEEEKEEVFANIFITDLSFKIGKKNLLRFEIQLLKTHQDMGDWFMFLTEYSYSPHFFFSFQNQYNYGNKIQKLHYPVVSLGYKINSTRFTISYGKQKEGIICVGGVCRVVPSTNGVFFTLNSSF